MRKRSLIRYSPNRVLVQNDRQWSIHLQKVVYFEYNIDPPASLPFYHRVLSLTSLIRFVSFQRAAVKDHAQQTRRPVGGLGSFICCTV